MNRIITIAALAGSLLLTGCYPAMNSPVTPALVVAPEPQRLEGCTIESECYPEPCTPESECLPPTPEPCTPESECLPPTCTLESECILESSQQQP